MFVRRYPRSLQHTRDDRSENGIGNLSTYVYLKYAAVRLIVRKLTIFAFDLFANPSRKGENSDPSFLYGDTRLLRSSWCTYRCFNVVRF